MNWAKFVVLSVLLFHGNLISTAVVSGKDAAMFLKIFLEQRALTPAALVIVLATVRYRKQHVQSNHSKAWKTFLPANFRARYHNKEHQVKSAQKCITAKCHMIGTGSE